jgi:hypothetical protein
LLESERYRSLRELAAAKGVDRSFVGRILSIPLLAPDIVEAIPKGRQPYDLQIGLLLTSPPAS